MGGSAGVVTLLFTDLVASTELLARLGDHAAEDLRRVQPEITVVPVERLERIASSGKLKRFIPLGAKG